MNGSDVVIVSGPEDESDKTNKDDWEELLANTVFKKKMDRGVRQDC